MTTKSLGLTKKQKEDAEQLVTKARMGFKLTDDEKTRLERYHAIAAAKAEERRLKASITLTTKKEERKMSHKLSAFDRARKQLKADGVKTDQSTTKASLMASLSRSSNPVYKKLAADMKAEAEAKGKKPAKKKAAKKVVARKPRAKKSTEAPAAEEKAAA